MVCFSAREETSSGPCSVGGKSLRGQNNPGGILDLFSGLLLSKEKILPGPRSVGGRLLGPKKSRRDPGPLLRFASFQRKILFGPCSVWRQVAQGPNKESRRHPGPL